MLQPQWHTASTRSCVFKALTYSLTALSDEHTSRHRLSSWLLKVLLA